MIDVILPAFAGQLLAAATAGSPLTRDMAGRASVYLQARTHYGILAPAVLDPVRVVWRAGARRTRTSRRSTSCSPESSGSPTAIWTRSTAPPATTGRSSAPADPPPADGQSTGPGQDDGDGSHGSGRAENSSADERSPSGGLARRGAPAGARSRRPRGSSSSSTRTLDLQQVLEQAAGRDGRAPTRAARPRHRAADRPDARPRRRPAARARRDPARPPLRHPAAPGAHPRHPQIDKRTPGRTVRRPRLHPRTGAAPDRQAGNQPPLADHPPGARADPGAARRAGDRHLRLDGRLRVRARADLLDPHRRPAADRRAVRDRAVRQQRRAALRRHPTAGARARDPDRRRHRVRRRRDRARLRPARDDQPPPPPIPLRALGRRLERHTSRGRADPVARRARRPDDPPQSSGSSRSPWSAIAST